MVPESAGLTPFYWTMQDEMSTIDEIMPHGSKHRFFLKRCGLLLCSMLFLGSAEISAYKTPADSRLSYHKDDVAGSVAVTDQIFAEDGEERDGESLADTYTAAHIVGLPRIDFIRQSIDISVTVSKSFFVYLPSNPRAPPAL